MAEKKVQAAGPITYSLRSGQPCSCAFYREIAPFTAQVIADGERQFGALLDDYLLFLQETGAESVRTRPEYLFELLALGVLWRTYGQNAAALSPTLARLLAWLSDLRERNKRFKKAADLARGLFAYRLRSTASGAAILPLSSAADIDRLLRWMRAAGRLKQETTRLETWRAFLARLPGEQARETLATVTAFAAWFEERSLAVLGEYTPRVDHFLALTHPLYRWREDYILCGRRRVEYHLNMLGTEILNQALRDSFLRAKKKIVLVPPCMRALPDDQCKAVSTPFGARCMACTPGCHVHQLTRLGEKHGFEVFTLPDDLRVFSGETFDLKRAGQVGIVGVSCVLTNVQGGWDVRKLGIPAQGLLLDYCGCSYHWHKQGIATNIDFHQLLRILS